MVKVEDSAGNVVTSVNTGTASATIASGAGGSIAAGGTSGTFANGVATFSGLGLNGVNGTTYTLTFTGGGFTSAASNGITVSTGAANKLVITTQPSTTDASGAALATQPVVKVEDSGGNVVTSVNTGTASATIASAPVATNAAGGTSGTFANGVATFSGLGPQRGERHHLHLHLHRWRLHLGALERHHVSHRGRQQTGHHHPALGTTDASGAALATQPVVKVEDSGNNVVTSVNTGTASATIASGAGGSIAAGGTSGTFANGVATFSGLGLNGVNGTTYTLTFTGGGFTSVPSNGITVSTGAANKLVITTQPSTTDASGAALATQPVVKVEDSAGNVVTSVNTGTASATIASGAGGSIAAGGTSGTFANGVATFSGLGLNGVNGTTYTLTFTGGGFTSAASNGITVSTGAATQLVFTTQPAAGASGAALTTQPVIKVEDSGNNVVTSSTQTITLTPSAGTLSSCGGLRATAGVITVTGCTFAGTVGANYSLFAQTTSNPVVSGTSNNFSPTTFGAATQLAITTQPSATANSGAALGTQPVVKVEDSGGNVVTSVNTGTASATIASGAGGSIAAGGTSGTFANGVATFSGLALNGVSGTTYTLTFNGDGFTSVPSNGITMSTGAATQLVITTQPSGAASGSALTTQPVVKVEDSGNNVVTSATGTMTATINTGTGGAITAGSTATISNGVATFSNLAMTGVTGNSYSLHFSNGTLSVNSAAFTMTFGNANKLVITTQPSATDASGAALATQPVVKVEDSAGNVVTSDSSTVTASFTSGGVSLTNPTKAAVNGVATFSGLALNALAGNYTLTFSDGGLTTAVSNTITVSTGAATQLAITTQPSATANSGAALGTQPVVKVEDSGGNVVTSVNTGTASATIASGAGGSIAAGGTSGTFANGVATFSGLTLNGVSGTTYTLTFNGDGFTSVPSNGITMSTGAATQLVITTQPSGAASGSALTTQPVVKVEDSGNNVVTSATGTMTATINTGTGGAITAGSTATISNGVATFSNLAMTGVTGNSYSLHFSNGTLSVNSAAFTMTFGNANKLVITTQPSTTDASGAALATQPVVKVEDSAGNVVTTDSSTVTASFTSGGVSLTNPTKAAANGVATFSGLALNALAGNYTLTFSDGGLTTAVSNTITVSTGAATQLAITTQPSATANSGAALGTQPVVKVEDSGGNVVTSVNTGTASATIASGAGGSIAAGGTSGTFANGVATFSGLALNGVSGTTYTLTFNGGGFTSVPSNGITVSTGAATQLVITTQPSGAASGSALTTQPVVKVEDSGNNVVTSATGTMTATINTGTGGAITAGSTATISNGVATFSNLAMTGVTGNSYSLHFSNGTLSVNSAAFTMTFGNANKLVITTQPSTTDASGAALATQPVVKVEDSAGNVVTSVNTGTASATIASGAGGSIAAGGTSGTFANGVATFSGLGLNGVNGTTYTLTFTGGGFTSAASNGITVSTGTATQLVFTTQPAAGASGAAFTTQPVIKVEDSGNNVVTTSTQTITLNQSAGTLSSCGGLRATAGVITVTGCTFAGTVGANYSLFAQTTSNPVVSGTSNNFSPTTFGAATQLVFTTQPGNATGSGRTLNPQPAVSIEDSGGNVVTTATNRITLAIGTSQHNFSTLNVTTNPLAATNGVATFSGVSITHTGQTTYTGWTLTATATGLGTVTSSAFTT